MSYQKKLEEFDEWLKELGPDGFKSLWERYEKEVLKEQDETKMRKLTKKEIEEILSAHQLWHETKGVEGEQANFRRVDLRGVDFIGADLRGSNFEEANLKGSDFEEANLELANFQGANLELANFRGSNLRGANLERASLQGAELDFSCLSLSCETLSIGSTDKRQCAQIAYHLLRFMDACADLEVIHIRNDKKLIEFANKFHRVAECGMIEKKESVNLKEQEEEEKARMAEIHQCAYNKIKDHLDGLTDEEFLEEWDAIEYCTCDE